ncbi:MAG: hypothetical protein H7251_20660 [Acetobacteraceae bacterium]|nr:hypothetical protein [Acetobacteraceae bacterium]
MNTLSSSPFSLPETAPELARRFCVILAGLAGLVARRFLRMPHLMRFTLLLWGRLSRAVPRFVRALDRPAKPRGQRARTGRTARTDQVRVPGLPTGRGWLVRELGWEAVGFASQMEALLNEPGMQATLLNSPGLARILRPICRMLGVAPVVVLKIAAAVAVPEMVVVTLPPVWVRAAADVATDESAPGMDAVFLPA